MLASIAGAVAVICTGVVCGVFVAVAVSVVPTLASLPPERYVEIHQRLGQGYHPLMPIVVLGGLVANLAAIPLAAGAAPRTAYATAVVALLGVQVVSHLRNERINRRVRAVRPLAVPVGWPDPRPAWRGWHLVRTLFAVLALAADAVGLALLTTHG
ncbi:DUF1772 domain-containing protein [Micromonospora sp. CPCC 206061]|uniref:DUF1772 domain-containing protein n=1 Tax=Micromonospora sp. CPCC 206061 TaxID=3122410 RepID=UPI002FF0DF31